MRIEAILWSGTAVFYAVLAAVYVAVGGDAAGGSLLTVGVGFGALVGAWLWHWTRHNAVRAEDRADAGMADEIGELGVFVTSSWRPIAFAASATALLAGLVVGTWLSAIGLALVCFHTVGSVLDAR